MHTFSRRAVLAGFASLIALGHCRPGAYIIDDWR